MIYGTVTHQGQSYKITEQAVVDTVNQYHAVGYNEVTKERVIVTWSDNAETQEVLSVEAY